MHGGYEITKSIFALGYFEIILSACTGTLFVLLGLELGRKEWKILDPIKNIGVYTYWILCIHSVECMCVPWYRWAEVMGQWRALAFGVDLALVAVLLVGCCTALKKLSRWNYKHNKEGKISVMVNGALDALKLDEKKFKIRLDTFNLLKGALIIFVVLAHKAENYHSSELMQILESPVFKVVRNSAMPAFFIIAGMSFKATTVKKCLSKTFKDLMIPYLYVMAAFAVCFPLIHYAAFHYWEGALHESTSYFPGFLLGMSESGGQLFGYTLYECSAVWFLIALFIALNIMNLVLKVKNQWIRHGLIILIFLFGNLLEKHHVNFYSLSRAVTDVGFCYVGYLVKEHKAYTRRCMPILFAAMAILTIYSANPGEGSTAVKINALSACSGLLFVFLGIILGRVQWKILAPIKSAGVLSYWILCVHAVELRCVPWYMWSQHMGEKQLLAYGADLAAAGLVIGICCFILKKVPDGTIREK